MRIAYLFSRFPVGTQVFAVSDIAALRAMGHGVSIDGLLTQGKDAKRLVGLYGLEGLLVRHAGLRTLARFGAVVVTRPLWLPRAVAFAVAKLWKTPVALLRSLLLLPRTLEIVADLAREKPDVVHAFWGHYPVFPLLVAKRLLGVPVTMFLGAYDLFARYPLTAVALREVDAVFSHAHVNVPAILEVADIGKANVQVVHRGIPVDDFADLETGKKVRHRLCTTSALVKSKNVDKVIEAFAVVRKACPAATLVVCGDGPERGALEALAKTLGVAEAVRFTGYLKRSDVLEEMAQAEVFVFLSQKESDRLPNVVKEAMLAECGVVVSDTLGIAELVTSSKVGVVTESLEAKAVAKQVEALLRDAVRRKAMGKLARVHVLKNFTSEAAMKAYLKTWSKVANP
jgi:glycosyltransferase involved in cell wall biosynthesis